MRPPFTSRDVSFVADVHEYHLPDGTRLPSVTEILQETGVAVDFDALAGLSHRIEQAIDLKRDVGRALHADAWAYDDNDLDWATVDPRVRPYLEAWVTFRENTSLAPLTRERLVYHPIYGYAGTLDGIFAKPNGRRVLVDLKTGDPDSSGCQFQTAAYREAYVFEHRDEDPRMDPIERWGVQLTPERRVPYRIFPYEAFDDFAKFQSFVTTYHCQAARRRTAAIV